MGASLEQTRELKDQVLSWLDRQEWKGVDPFDGLNSELFRPVVDGSLARFPGSAFVRLAVLQAVKRSPWNLRPMLWVQPQENGMSWAVGLLGALRAVRRGDEGALKLAERAFQRLLALEDPATHLWGYPFPWQARAFYLKTNEPNLVISAIGLWALAEFIGLAPQHFPKLEKQARAHYESALPELVKRFYKPEGGFFSYVGHEAVLVHNANLFGAQTVIEAVRLGIAGADAHYEKAVGAIRKTLEHQEENGRWSYGTMPHHSWADNFHTAYNLSSLGRMMPVLLARDPEGLGKACEISIRRGLRFYLDHAFTPEGSARYYDQETWPLETHSAASALVCLNELAEQGWLDRGEARKVASQAVQAVMKDTYLGNGEFAYRRWPKRRIKMVFARWTQSWMYFGLESAVSLLG